jgi:hypothetical protein
MRGYAGWSEDIHSLQVVMTYATDYQYRLRCLPWFMHKGYLNRHVFDGVHKKDWVKNELYVWHKCVNLSSDGSTSPMEQLYTLFVEYGIDETFAYLSGVAKSSADMFLLHKSLYNTTKDPYHIARKVEESIADDLAIYSLADNTLPLDRIVSTTTYDLLNGMSGYLKKKY